MAVTNWFEDWSEVDAKAGRVARDAWLKAQADAAALGPNAVETQAAEVLKALVMSLNPFQLEIDTILREDAGEAFMELAATMGVEDEQAQEWFDEWRDF